MPARHRRRRRERADRASSKTGSPAATSCCSPAAPRRVRAICATAPSHAFDDPGIVVHGVALKPGKPLCLAVTGGKPIVVLPGFPTSAIFTFHEFVAPVIRAFAGLPPEHGRAASGDPAVARRLGARPHRISDGVAGPRRRMARWPPIPTPRARVRSPRSARPTGSSRSPAQVESVPAGTRGRGAADRSTPISPISW